MIFNIISYFENNIDSIHFKKQIVIYQHSLIHFDTIILLRIIKT